MSHRFSAAFQPAGPRVIEMQIPSALGRPLPPPPGVESGLAGGCRVRMKKALLYAHTTRGATESLTHRLAHPRALPKVSVATASRSASCPG